MLGLLGNLFQENCLLTTVGSMMAQWLDEYLRNMKCLINDLKLMGSHPSQVMPGVHSTFGKVVLDPTMIR